MEEKFSFKTVSTITQVPRESWDAMADNNPFMSWGWLKTAEETQINKQEVYYLLMMNQDKLLGGAVCSVAKASTNEMSLDNAIFGRLKKPFHSLNISLTPFLQCSPLNGRGINIVIDNHLPGELKANIFSTLLEKIENLAYSKNISLSFHGIKQEQSEFRNTLLNKGYLCTLDYGAATMDIRWSDFEQYLLDKQTISAKTRQEIRRQIRRNQKAGVIISELQTPETLRDRLHYLLSLNTQKHNQAPFKFNKYFFEQLKNNMSKEAMIFIAEKQGCVIGVHIFLAGNDHGSSCFIGIDHEAADNDFTYFNLGYYSLLKNAIRTNTQKIDYGNGLFTLKSKLGCTVQPTYIFFKPAHFFQKFFIPVWFQIHSHWNKRKLSKYIASLT